MNAIMDKLVDDVHAVVAETCARCAEIHRMKDVNGDGNASVAQIAWADGYNTAVAEIAKAIRDIKRGAI